MTLYGRSTGQANGVVGTAATDATGYYLLVAPAPTADTIYYATAAGATSPSKAVKVSPEVTIHGPAETSALLTGVKSRVTFSGTVSPTDKGAEVVLQREQAIANEEWHPIQRGIVGANGAYSFIHVFAIPGDANIRVVVRPHRGLSAFGASTPLSYVISQRQNPLLTLIPTGSGATSDPILYAQTLTLHGVLAGGSGQTITLESRSKTGQFADRRHDRRPRRRCLQLHGGAPGEHGLQGAGRRTPLGDRLRGCQIHPHGGSPPAPSRRASR